MPLAPSPPQPYPAYWTIFGHSYYNLNIGTATPQGRIDGYMRRMINLDQAQNWQNHAQAGSRLTYNGDYGWARIMQAIQGTTATTGPYYLGSRAPYLIRGIGNSGGAYLIGYGINDVGLNGNTTQWNTIYANCLKAAISRCRMSNLGNLGNNNYTGGVGSFANSGYGASAESSGICSGTGLIYTAGAGNNFTLTLPADYAGEPITILFICQPGGGSNLVTFTGTAGVTGTCNTAAASAPASTSNWVPFPYRITGLTSAAASHTIVCTLTTADTNGTWLYVDSWWLEADNPPPVVVCNSVRTVIPTGNAAYVLTLTATNITGGTTTVAATPGTITVASTVGVAQAGTFTMPSSGGTVTITYTGITATSFTGCTASGGSGTYTTATITTPGPTLADVQAFNAVVPPVIGQFDGMVQLADLDGGLGGLAPIMAWDGLHLNELGASKAATIIMGAIQRMVPSSPYDAASDLNPPGQQLSSVIRTSVSGQWYGPECSGLSTSTTYTPVVGDQWALPFYISGGEVNLGQWMMQEVAASAAPTVEAAIYDDHQHSGYPQFIYAQLALGTPLTLLAAPGVFLSTTTVGNNGCLLAPFEPGLWWFVIKIITAGTGVTFATCQGPSLFVPQLLVSGVQAAAPCAWKLTGQGTTAIAGRYPAGAVPAGNAPMVGVLVS